MTARNRPFHRRLAEARRRVAAIEAGTGVPDLPRWAAAPWWCDQLGAALLETHAHGVRAAVHRHAGWASTECPVIPAADPDELVARAMAARPDDARECRHVAGALAAPRPFFDLLDHGSRVCAACLPPDPFAAPLARRHRCGWCDATWPPHVALEPFVFDTFTLVTVGQACAGCRWSLHNAMFGPTRMAAGGGD